MHKKSSTPTFAVDSPSADDDGWANSFVTSVGDPTTGYFFPVELDYVYKIRCRDAKTCSFRKISMGPDWKNPIAPVVMSIPPTSDSMAC